MTKTQCIEKVLHEKVIAIIRANNDDQAAKMVEALHEGGISLIEITMTVPNSVELIARLASTMGDNLIIGAGTVMGQYAASQCIQAGAQFIVSPVTDVPTVQYCQSQGVAIFPGALTPTEIIAAKSAGADIVKVFPCVSLGGPSYIKNLRGPFPDLPLMATGGVSINSVMDYFNAGANCVGIGGELCDPTKTHAELIDGAKKLVTLVHQ